MSIDVTTFQDNLYNLIKPLIQNPSVQTMTFSAETVVGNKINGKIDGVSITEILFTSDHASTMNLLATELLTFKTVKSVQVNGNVLTITSIQVNTPLFTDFLVTEGSTQPTIIFAETRTEIALIWADQATTQPKPPYATMKLIAGPVQVGFDELRDTSGSGDFKLKGLRSFTLSLNAYGKNSFTILSRVQDNVSLQEVMSNFKAKSISVYNATAINDITALAATTFESRHTMDLMLYSGTEVETVTGPIESAGISGDLKKPDGTIYPVDEFIVSL